MKRLSSRGETIVEVLIVVLILTSVMSTAFAITTHTLNQDRASQERTEAATIAQGQIERLNAAVRNSPTGSIDISPTNLYFCLDSNLIPQSVPSPSAIPVGCTSNARYGHYLQYFAAIGTYTETVVWDNATGTGKDTLTIVYRPIYISLLEGSIASVIKPSNV